LRELEQLVLSDDASLDASLAATSSGGTELPSGVVTFLMTDIVGSTRLWQQAPAAMVRALERHDDIIRSAVASHRGVMVKSRGEGDSTFNVFAKASDAAAAAVEAQAVLGAEEWPPSCRPAVRMAIHTGEAIQREADYFGTTVNRAARIRAIAEGGETLVSAPAAAVISDQVPEDTRLVEVGRAQLKDLQGRETIHLLQRADADGGFSVPRSLGLVEHNLPQQTSSFVGRANEIAEIAGLLDRWRLVTLTGAGGAGKSRLAVEAAWTEVERFDDGVWLVELAPLDDSLLVAQLVAAVMSILEQPGRPILKTLTGALRGRRVLIVLDNCEHLIDGVAKVTAALLRDCSEVKVLATSREPLRIEGELAYRVPSLSLPANDASTGAVAASEAVRLFLERCGASRPSLRVDDPTIAAVGSICRHLDGMPLAIELAAARVNVMPIADIEARLDHRFGLLTTGARSALPRHQTLQALIDWSYDLLSEAEQAVLRRLSAFAGGFTLEAAEAVCGSDDVESSEVFGLVASLVNKSLVQFEEGEEGIRYRLLETIRAYGATKLARSAESKDVVDRHLKWFIDLAERAEGQLEGPNAKLWLDILEADHDNLRAALQISAEENRGNEGLRLAAALGRFWEVRGHFREGRGWLGAVLAMRTDVPASVRIRALLAAIRMAARLHQEQDARMMGEECLAISQDVGDRWGMAKSLNALGLIATDQGEYEHARARYESSLAIAEAIDDKHVIADTLCKLGLLAMVCGDALGARQMLEQSRALQEELGDARGLAYSLNYLGYLACDYGDYDEGLIKHRQALRIRRDLADKLGSRDSLDNVGHTYLLTGDFVRARQYLEESLALQRELGWASGGGRAVIDGIEWTLSDLGELSAAEGDLRGARILLEESLVRSNEVCRMITLTRLGNVFAKELEFTQSDRLHLTALTLAKKASDLVRLVACLEGVATTAKLKGQWRRSARLFGAASAIRESIQSPVPPYQQRDHDNDVSTLRGHLGDFAFESAFSEGQALDRDEAVEFALSPYTLPP
jgi:predicted ATPase/class 3 adenylate cyclase